MKKIFRIILIASAMLMLTACEGEPILDKSTGLIWESQSHKSMIFLKAKEHCEKLTEGDFNNWRLPTISELNSVRGNKTIFKNIRELMGVYWSSQINVKKEQVFVTSVISIEDLRKIPLLNMGTFNKGGSLQNIKHKAKVRCVSRNTEELI